jgi:outer membrane protein TolC
VFAPKALTFALACLLLSAPLLPAWSSSIDELDPQLSEDIPEVTVLKGSLSKTDTVSLNLEEALRIAESDNPLLQLAGAQVNEARARYHTRIAEMIPDVEMSYGQANYLGAMQTFTNQVINVDRRSHQPQLVFRFPIFQGGRRIFQLRAAGKSLSAEQANQETSRQQTLRQTATNYYELKRRLEQIAIARQQLEETRSHLDMNTARLEAGVGTRLDVLQSEAQVARAHYQLLEAVRGAEVAALRLNEMLDLPAIAAVVPAEQGQQMQTLVPMGVDFHRLLAVAHNQRPELKAIGKQIESLQEIRRVVWTSALPEVNLEYRTGRVGANLSDVQTFDETSLALGMKFRNMLASVITLGKENKAQIETMKHRLEATINTIEREVSEAFLLATTKQAQIAAARTEVIASQQALADAIERMHAGVGRNIDVIEAETGLTRARTNLSSTILEYNLAQVDMVYYLGLASVETLTQGIQLP